MKTVEIFSIGDELLRGIVADSNSHWMAQRVTARGAALRRVTVLPDEPELCGAELAAAVERAPALLLTQGGLGPTDDDRTREALARATGLPLQPHPEAAEIVRSRFATLVSEGIARDAAPTEDRMRMARLPRGATALDNQIGTAPGVLLRAGATTVVALPGVPPELRWIWENSLAPHLDEILGPGSFCEVTFTIEHKDESSIAWLLRLAQDRHPAVYVKSRAKGYGEDDELRITLAASGPSDADARALVDQAGADVRAALSAEGIAIRDE